MHGFGEALKSILVIDGLNNFYIGISLAMRGPSGFWGNLFRLHRNHNGMVVSRRHDLSSPCFIFVSRESGDIIA